LYKLSKENIDFRSFILRSNGFPAKVRNIQRQEFRVETTDHSARPDSYKESETTPKAEKFEE
jgi:hypothetical protein